MEKLGIVPGDYLSSMIHDSENQNRQNTVGPPHVGIITNQSAVTHFTFDY